jgi:hypothetical protein
MMLQKTRGMATLADTDYDDNEENSPPLVVVEFHDDNDGKVTTVTVEEGTKITEAATKAGVYIPTVSVHCLLSLLSPICVIRICIESLYQLQLTLLASALSS